MHWADPAGGELYRLNYGVIESPQSGSEVRTAYVIGIDHPVKSFDGRVIAVIHRKNSGGDVYVVSPKSKKYIINDISEAVSFAEPEGSCTIECLYERSCGAVIYRNNGEARKFLLIKNKRSAHWGFPKGHIEKGETPEQTALREVLEETGLKIELLPEFTSRSEYTIQGKVEKNVTIFLAKALTNIVRLQEEEIDGFKWLGYNDAMKTLKFENDKSILRKAFAFMQKNSI